MGLGTASIKETLPFITAVRSGYRHFDTATKYGNEEYLGEALAQCMAGGLVKREELYITTKLWHDNYNDPEAALRLSLKKLQMDYVDMYLIHWPVNGVCDHKIPMHKLWAMLEGFVE